MLTPRCPECKSTIDIADKPVIGEMILCAACKKEFKVTWLYPITLDIENQDILIQHTIDVQLEANGGQL